MRRLRNRRRGRGRRSKALPIFQELERNIPTERSGCLFLVDKPGREGRPRIAQRFRLGVLTWHGRLAHVRGTPRFRAVLGSKRQERSVLHSWGGKKIAALVLTLGTSQRHGVPRLIGCKPMPLGNRSIYACPASRSVLLDVPRQVTPSLRRKLSFYDNNAILTAWPPNRSRATLPSLRISTGSSSPGLNRAATSRPARSCATGCACWKSAKSTGSSRSRECGRISKSGGGSPNRARSLMGRGSLLKSGR